MTTLCLQVILYTNGVDNTVIISPIYRIDIQLCSLFDNTHLYTPKAINPTSSIGFNRTKQSTMLCMHFIEIVKYSKFAKLIFISSS